MERNFHLRLWFTLFVEYIGTLEWKGEEQLIYLKIVNLPS